MIFYIAICVAGYMLVGLGVIMIAGQTYLKNEPDEFEFVTLFVAWPLLALVILYPIGVLCESIPGLLKRIAQSPEKK